MIARPAAVSIRFEWLLEQRLFKGADISVKLEISFYRYLYERISANNQIPPLDEFVFIRAKELDLGWSFFSTPRY